MQRVGKLMNSGRIRALPPYPAAFVDRVEGQRLLLLLGICVRNNVAFCNFFGLLMFIHFTKLGRVDRRDFMMYIVKYFLSKYWHHQTDYKFPGSLYTQKEELCVHIFRSQSMHSWYGSTLFFIWEKKQENWYSHRKGTHAHDTLEFEQIQCRGEDVMMI